MGEQDDLPIIELDADTDGARPPRPRIGARRRRMIAMGTALVVVAAAVTIVAARGRHAHARAHARTDDTIVLPPAKRTVATIDPDAETVDDMGMIEPHRGWALNEFALSTTSDDGTQWRVITPPALAGAIRDISAVTFLDAEHAWIVVSPRFAPDTMWRTADGGRSWTRLPHFCTATPNLPSCTPVKLDFVDAVHGWALVGAKDGVGPVLLTTSDGGTTWRPGTSTPFSGSLQFVDARHAWGFATPQEDAAGEGSIFRTTDGGFTWQPVAPPELPAPETSILVSTPAFFGSTIVSTRFVIVPGAEPRLVVFTSDDAGARWAAHPVPARFTPAMDDVASDHSVAVTPTSWIVTVGPDIWITRDGGADWSRSAPTGGNVQQLAFASPLDGWVLVDAAACATTERDCPAPYLYGTRDGGRTWTLRSPTAGLTAERSP